MKSIDIMLLERCAQGPVSFTHAPTVRGHTTKLVRSTVSPKQQAPLHQLALAGLVAEAVDPQASISPPESTVTYTLTARGRDALGLHARQMPPQHNFPLPSDAQLIRESKEPV